MIKTNKLFKKIFITLVISVVFWPTGTLHAKEASDPWIEAEEPTNGINFEGFRSLKWGTKIAQDKSFSPLESMEVPAPYPYKTLKAKNIKNISWFKKDSDKLSIEDIALSRINYWAFKEKVYKVQIEIDACTEASYQKLYDLLKAKYGKTISSNKTYYAWVAGDTSIILKKEYGKSFPMQVALTYEQRNTSSEADNIIKNWAEKEVATQEADKAKQKLNQGSNDL